MITIKSRSELENILRVLKNERPSKYNNATRDCNLGHHHDSIAERDYCWKLFVLQEKGYIKEIEYEKRYELRVNDVLITTHKPDFTVTTDSGAIEVHEVKGFRTPEWLIKSRLFPVCYPDLPYIVVPVQTRRKTPWPTKKKKTHR